MTGFVAGDVNIEELSITNFDGSETQNLRSYFLGIELRESIFENVMAGQVSINDTSGLHRLLPIIGEEILTVRFRTSDSSALVDKVFRVYKLSNFIRSNNNQYSYTLHFVSPELIENEKVRVRRAYKDMSAEKIAADMFTLLKSIKPIESDLTIGTHQVVVADMKPLQAINMITTYSQSEQYEGACYLFYENRDGYHYKTLDSLYAAETVVKLKYEMRTATQSEDSEQFNALIDFSMRQKFDLLNSISKGMFSNTVMGVDLIAKDFKSNSFSYEDRFDGQTHVEPGVRVVSGSFVDISSQMFKVVNSRGLRDKSAYFKANNGSAFSYTKSLEDTLPHRMSQIHQANTLVLDVLIYGNTDIAAGNVVELDLPSMAYEEKNNQDITEATLSGRYLVRDIAHRIEAGKYTQSLVLVKDCHAVAAEKSV